MQIKLRSIWLKFVKTVSILLLILFLVLSAMIGNKLYGTWKVGKINQQLSEIRAQEQEEGDWSKGMLEVNEDYVGWLTIYGTGVDGPVLQGEDNNEYLRTDIYHEYSIAGTLFMDELVDTEVDGNIIIYGHMMNDSTMFGDLKKYKDKSFLAENNIVRWEDVRGEHYYKLFAATLVSGSATNTGYLNLQQWANIIDEQETKLMLGILKEKSFLYQDNMFRGEGQYIFLMTCDYTWNNYRLVLVGKRM